MKRRVFLSVLVTVPFLNWLAPAVQKSQSVPGFDGLGDDGLFSFPQFENAIRTREAMAGVALDFPLDSPHVPTLGDLVTINGQLMRTYRRELLLDVPTIRITFAYYSPAAFADGYDTLTAHL